MSIRKDMNPIPPEQADWVDNDPDSTYSTIRLRVHNGTISVRLDFQPQIDPKNLTFDQMAASVGVQAISQFIQTGELPPINDKTNDQKN